MPMTNRVPNMFIKPRALIIDDKYSHALILTTCKADNPISYLNLASAKINNIHKQN